MGCEVGKSMTIIQLKKKYEEKLSHANKLLSQRHNDYVSAFQMAYEEVLKDLEEIDNNKN